MAIADTTQKRAVTISKPTFGMRLGKTVDRWLLPRLGVPWHARVSTGRPDAAPMTT